MIYTGIGSRTISVDTYTRMIKIGEILAELGWTLRSGGANGSDAAFERGCDLVNGKKEIYLPWKNFNNSTSTYYHIPEESEPIAKQAYKNGNFNNLKPTTKKFMQRNVLQVLGQDLTTLSDVVICWTKDGCTNHEERSPKTGGTGQAISVASFHCIPVFNLNNQHHYADFFKFVEQKAFNNKIFI